MESKNSSSNSDNFKKQELLKKEIIDKNIDKDLFFDYCIQKKENGDDLDNWTFEELRETITEFSKAEVQINKNDKQDKKKKKVIKIDITEDDKLNEIEEQVKYGENVNEEKCCEKEIICKKIDKNLLNDKEIKIQIRNPKIIEGGFFGINFVAYEIFTENFDWNVRRRYSDFENFRNILVKLFPGCLIPPLPNKKVGGRRFEEDFIEKRRISLQKFMNLILANEVLKSCEFTYVFLNQQDRQILETKVKEYNSIQQPQYVEDFKTLDGKIKIVDDENNEKYYRNINRYLNVQHGIFLRMNEAFKNFINNYTAAMENLEELEFDFNSLKKLNSKVSMNDEIIRTYDNYNVFFKNWSKLNIINYFRKNRLNEFCVFTDIVKARDEIKSKYNSELLKLNVKKEKLWSSMETSKWEINEGEKIDKTILIKDKNFAFSKMCFKETNNLNNLHNKLGYYNKKLIDELKGLIKSHVHRYTQEISSFSEEFYPSLTDVKYFFYLFLNLGDKCMVIFSNKYLVG